MSIQNLLAMMDRADVDDRVEGKMAYERYNKVMWNFAREYGQPMDRTVAAFVALSPNNDYFSNLRSLASCLAHMDQAPDDEIIVSTYNHCKDRALAYLRGRSFLDTVKGPKVRAFYQNILNPWDHEPVTIDGHMKASWLARQMTMKEAIIRGRREYEEIAQAVRDIAAYKGMIANQVQATIWFARKRTLGVVYNPQMKLFAAPDDKWNTMVDPRDAPPYPLKRKEELA